MGLVLDRGAARGLDVFDPATGLVPDLDSTFNVDAPRLNALTYRFAWTSLGTDLTASDTILSSRPACVAS